MRMRTRSHLDERIAACNSILTENFSDAIREIADSRPIHIEIGCGKGRFITETAKLNPDIRYIAVEKVSNVIVLAMEKAVSQELSNLRFMRGNFQFLSESFPDKCVDRIYLNFSDPWPKSRHEKNRLTSDTFRPLYIKVLTDGGYIFQKTDNRGLFEYSLEVYRDFGCVLENVTFDLHASEWAADNIVTEYEANFSAKGFKINRLEAYLPKNT